MTSKKNSKPVLTKSFTAKKPVAPKPVSVKSVPTPKPKTHKPVKPKKARVTKPKVQKNARIENVDLTTATNATACTSAGSSAIRLRYGTGK